ncbi:MAG: acyl-CoA dehydrogenase family protein [Trueperaceae bacterium]|nr:acyl-CoA dehydrogenase family protein [Trueperaceae bacterium]
MATKLDDLAKQIDPRKLAELADKVDIDALLERVSRLDADTLQSLMRTLQKQTEPLDMPAPDGDFYAIADTLSDEQRELQRRVRDFMETEVAPIINDYWSRDTFPQQLIAQFRDLDLVRHIYDERGERRPDASVTEGIITMEMARVDVSTATFFGVQSGLVMASVAVGGSDEQKRAWIPKLRDLEQIGAFGLTEPEVGSAISKGMQTRCRRDDDGWVLNGEKYWIGNATFADVIVVWAKDEDDGQVKGFLVPGQAEGLRVEKITGKIALRAVENGHVFLDNCRVDDSARLANADSFRQTSDVLRMTRAGVAWQAVGAAMGAYEKTLAYTQSRQQFKRPIANFQLVQEKLVRMLGNVTAMQTMCLRLSRLQDAGRMSDAQASLAKVFAAQKCRETVALGRELHGGKGILLETDIARLFSDAEAIYSYEGTHEINSLVVGRAITGLGAFV